MKKSRLLIALIAMMTALIAMFSVACGSTGGSSGSESTPESTPSGPISSNWEEMPENTNENLKYFGYFHSDGFRSQGSYIEEIATLKNSNVVLINSAFSNAIACERIELARSLGFKVIFSVHGFFTGGQIKVANSATLVENYQQVWEETTTALAEYIADGTILAFYFDEPAWNGVKEEDFRTVTKMIRETYPDVKVLTTMTVYDIGVSKYEGYPEINASYNEYCTDVSYDSYAKWNDETRRSYIEALKSKATNGQYIWGCATGFSNNPEQTGELYNAIKGMYTEAIQEPRYAGILPFSYADGLEGDWGYGLHSFLNNESDYYDRELKQLYINIGREVCGMEPYDFSKDVEVILHAPNEVYEIGETIDLPAMGAADGLGNSIDFNISIVSPSGESVTAGSFVATESGCYVVTVTAGEGENQVSKSVNLSVRYENEISLFDDPAYLSDASGTDADTWCWPRQIDTTFYRSGTGSLRVTPHAKDGTWPRVIFARNGYTLWDISNSGGISMWVYNPSDEVIKGFSLIVTDEDLNNKNSIYKTVDIPSKEWTEVSLDMKTIKATIKNNKLDLDLTQVSIFYGNAAADYKNRTNFYIDDVVLLEKTEDDEEDDGIIDFEKESDISLIGTNVDDVWTWPYAISTEQAHGGNSSLKVTVRQDGAVWPNVVFLNSENNTFNLTNAEKISVWVYFDSDNAIETLGLKLANENDSNKTQKTYSIPARTWTEIVLTKDDFANGSTDLTNAYIKFAQLGGTYDDRSNFYLDDFTVVYGEESETPDNPVEPEKPVIPGGGKYDVPEGALSFELAGDILKVTGTNDDKWCWKPSLSDEQAHQGTQSLKITVHATDGTWPNVVFMNGESETFDLTKVTAICVWVYFDSDEPITTLGLKICNDGESNKWQKTYDIASRVWTEVYLSIDEITNASTDLTKAYVKFAQLGGGYSDRSNFYLDSFYVVSEEGAEPEQPENSEDTATECVDFENEEDLTLVGTNVDDVWTWPYAISTEQAHSGNSSLKVTVRQDGGVWPNLVIGMTNGGYTDITNIDGLYVWVYFDSNSTMETFAIKVNNGENVNQIIKGFVLPAKTWVKVTITKEEILAGAADIDLTAVRFCIANVGSTYDDRSNFYVDEFTTYAKEQPTVGYESDAELAFVGTNADDVWTWPYAISTEQAHSGNSSLKVTVRQDGGVWPNLVLGTTDTATIDLTNADTISVWVYFDSDTAMETFAIKVNNGENVNQIIKGFVLPAKTWVKITITKEEILAGAADIDLTAVRFCIANVGSSYDDRSNFYVDDLLVK